jgi:hypothetical protein
MHVCRHSVYQHMCCIIPSTTVLRLSDCSHTSLTMTVSDVPTTIHMGLRITLPRSLQCPFLRVQSSFPLQPSNLSVSQKFCDHDTLKSVLVSIDYEANSSCKPQVLREILITVLNRKDIKGVPEYITVGVFIAFQSQMPDSTVSNENQTAIQLVVNSENIGDGGNRTGEGI